MAIVFFLLMESQTLQAQLPSRSSPSAPPLQRTTAQPIGWNSEMETFLKRLADTYAKAQTYRDHGRVTLVQRNGRVKTTTEMPMELAFKRPNRLLLDGGQHQIACDGKSLVVAIAELRQYTSRPAPEQLDRKHLQAWSTMGGVEQGHPELIDLLIRSDAFDLWQKQMMKVNWQPDVKLEETPCRVLEYETTDATRVRLYIDPRRMILLRVQARSAAEGAQIDVSYDLGAVTLNGSIDEKLFAFTSPEGYRRVTQFSSGPNLGVEQQEESVSATNAPIVGKRAPLLAGKDLQGRMFAADELRGKVALLFFWSLAGGQYSLISLPVVQQAADYFQNKPDFLVLGISGDTDKAEVISQLMERKKCGFRTLLDEDQKLRRAYQIAGEPTFVVVDRDGKVTWARLGAPTTLRQDLLSEVEKALATRK